VFQLTAKSRKNCATKTQSLFKYKRQTTKSRKLCVTKQKNGGFYKWQGTINSFVRFFTAIKMCKVPMQAQQDCTFLKTVCLTSFARVHKCVNKSLTIFLLRSLSKQKLSKEPIFFVFFFYVNCFCFIWLSHENFTSHREKLLDSRVGVHQHVLQANGSESIGKVCRVETAGNLVPRHRL